MKVRGKFLAICFWSDSDGGIIRGGFLGEEDRNKLIALARDGSAASRMTRRANALVLLDNGWSCREVAKCGWLSESAQRWRSEKSWHGPCVSSQPLLAVERLVANDGWVASRVKAVSRRRRGPQARLYRACHPAILDHRGRGLTPATLLPPPSMRGFTPPVTPPQRGTKLRTLADSDAKCNATSARAHQGKARFSFLLRRLPLDFGDAKAAPGKGKSRRFKALRRCTSRRNSGLFRSHSLSNRETPTS